MMIVALDQVDLPSAYIMLQRFLTLDRFINVAEFFVPNQVMNFVAPRECRSDSGPMLFDALDQAIGDVSRA